jgi:glutamate-ammonia-ligase adenylyltransferase
VAGYDFLRRVALRLRIVHDFAVDHLPEDGRPLAQLARRLGYYGQNPGFRFREDYQRLTRAVRQAFDSVVQ